ncbi:MAG: 4Fe-4S binding protein [Actinobacteria bacterium]|nr:4Fe-4S binding protein [Actinomycetota bacterium]
MGRSKKSFDRILSLYKYKDLAFEMTNWPIIGSIGKKVMDADHITLTYIPISEKVELPESSALPTSIIEHFIENACHHMILHRCPCRSENGCKDYDPYFGCTFIGAAARDVDPEVGRHVTKEEALEHLHQATEMGLVSCLARFKGDAIMLGVKDHAHLMTICHCCPCCCLGTSFKRASQEVKDLLVKLEGLKVEVTENCNGCGLCVEACIFDAIEIKNGVAVVGEGCKGCGRCLDACRRDGVRISIDNPRFIEDCISRISNKVDVT